MNLPTPLYVVYSESRTEFLHKPEGPVGVSKAVNGIAHATLFVSILDADNALDELPHRIAKTMKVIPLTYVDC